MNSETVPCPICNSPAQPGTDWAIKSFSCPRCGNYEYDATIGWLDIKTPEHMVRLSGWVRDQNAAGVIPRITPENSKRVSAMSVPRYRERAARALGIIARKFGSLEVPTIYGPLINDLELQGVTYSIDAADADRLLHVLAYDGLITNVQNIGFKLTAQGMLAAEEMSHGQPASAQGFVAMSFAEALNDAWTNGFDPGIRSAGYLPFRIDAKEYVGGISDEIMSEIRRSRFVVADYTGQVNGVYFEAGFALGLGLTVIPTCRKDEIGKLHFDIKHLNTLLWQSPNELVDALAKRIRAVAGAGPNL
jgi:hypothetical protein